MRNQVGPRPAGVLTDSSSQADFKAGNPPPALILAGMEVLRAVFRATDED